MKCQICNKNEANIVFTQIINNEKIILQICTECAKKKGLSVEIHSAMQPVTNSLLGGLTGELGKKEKKDIPNLKCDICGLTFAEFKKTGLFGCDVCHEAFRDHVRNLLKQIHGTVVHEEKAPKRISKKIQLKQQLKDLQSELQNCVEMEDYERAATIRDQIESLEKEKNIK